MFLLMIGPAEEQNHYGHGQRLAKEPSQTEPNRANRLKKKAKKT